jgi:amino acid adenylation domain-containing protein
MLCKIWADVLGLERVGITDDFFRIGGDSILSIQVSSRIRKAGFNCQVKDLFSCKTIEKLSSHLLKQRSGNQNFLVTAPAPGTRHINISQDLLNALESRGDIACIYPANSLQQGFIYHALSQAVDDAYRVQRVYDYEQEIDVDKYINAWERCIETFPILRTAFNWDEEIIQVVYKKVSLQCQVHDMSAYPPEQRAARISAIQAADRAAPFDLARPPLLRLHIIKQASLFYTVIKTEQHIISDGWSEPILLKYLHQYYQDLVAGRKISVKEDTAYIAAQEYISCNKGDMAGYWKTVLREARAANDISALMSEQVDAAGYYRVTQPVAATLTVAGSRYKALRSFSRDAGITLNVILQFAWHKLLQAYSSSRYSIVGTTVSGRDLPVDGIAESVGLYINTLPLVIDWDNDNTILAQLHLVQQQVTALNTHSFADLATLQKEGQRLFHSLFVFENYPVPESDENSPKISTRDVIEKIDYPLAILVYEHKGTLTVRLQYDAKYLTEEKAGHHIATLKHILDQLIRKTDRPHREISLLYPGEYERVIHEWNDTAKDYSGDRTIHQLFEEQAARFPANISLVCQHTQLTYTALNELSNRLAAYLRDRYAVKADDLICLCLERNEYMLISILAVLKAGGAYVPVDTRYPDDRISYILSDTKAKAVLCNESNSARLKDMVRAGALITDVESVDSGTLAGRLQKYSKKGPVPLSSSSHLAYIIYTSGTTGLPKGVMVEHKSVVNTIQAFINSSLPEEGVGSCLSVCPFVFDVSVWEFFYTLFCGHTLHMLHTDTLLEPAYVAKYIIENRITSAYLPPTLLPDIAAYFEPLAHQLCLRRLLIGVMPIQQKVPQRYLDFLTGLRISNGYGPTETTIFSTAFHFVRAADPNGNVPIGRPISNTTVYILDAHLQPLPVGAVGELYIGGAGVARGYLNRPELTAERFIANPFQTVAEQAQGYNGRLYKTGDLVRYLPDGNLDYIGRSDFQVKIRGYRIELGEIESRLLSFSGIEQAVVLAKERAATGKYLVGYYVSGEPVDPGRLDDYLRAFLPDYMVPSAYVHMERFPVTVNGKLDRRALPDVELTTEEGYEAPGSELEENLCEVYGEILGISPDKISVRDDFFRLGGHSILAIQLVSKINKRTGFEMNISAVFKHKTIRQISDHIRSGLEPVVRIRPVEVAAPGEQLLSFAQERLWFIEKYEGGSHAYNIPMVFKIKPGTDVGRLLSAIKQVVRRHEVLRTVIRIDQDGRGYQEVLDEEETPLPVLEYAFSNREELDKSIAESMYRVFRLEKEYPVFAALYQYRDDQAEAQYISLVIHHIAFDAWSMDVFMKELHHYYYYVGPDGPGLPPLPLQYKDYAMWQRHYLSGPVLSEQLSYWMERLSGYETLYLRTDKPRPAQVSYAGDNVRFVLDEQLSASLRRAARQLEVSLFSLLLSAYYLLLRAYSGQQDLVVGTPIANRHYQDTHDLIGFFVNTLALREYIDDEDELAAFICRVNASVTAAQLHQDLPFEKLVDELRVEQDSSRHPVFQAMFVWQHAGRSREEQVNGLFDAYEPEYGNGYCVAKFDLSVILYDKGKEIWGTFNYATALFERATIGHYVETYRQLLAQVADMGNAGYGRRKLRELAYITKREYDQLISEWNHTGHAYPEEKTLAGLFEKQAIRFADQVAVSYEGKELSYARLNESANQLARYLRSKKVKTGDLVGICIERGLEMVIGVLGILKSGAGYVPVDPEYPKERMAAILADLKHCMVLSSSTFSGMLAAYPIELVLLDAGWDVIAECDKGPLSISIPADNVAYVLYTSGSTGVPKGVEMSAGPLINLILWCREYSETTPLRKVLQFSSLGFDVSFLEMFFAFACGGSLVLIDDQDRKDVKELLKLVHHYGITTLMLPFSIVDSITDHIIDQGITPVTLKELFATGEQLKLSQNLLTIVQSAQVSVFNLYGPTETHVATAYTVIMDDFLTRPLPPIGRPISNTTVYVLDAHLRPLPVGAVGELYIGGAGVARGYLNRPELTAERFIANPFQTAAEQAQGYNGRLYKTGDLVRYLPDGNLDYIGRSDFQVKIRGYRIELGEIESRLLSFSGIEQAVVLAKERAATGKYLVGYYVSGEPVDPGRLDDYLRAFLPDYMVPSAYVHMERFPVTVNGKLDRRALPDVELTTEEGYEAPGSELEENLCEVYGEILGISPDKISVRDDFFRLGGHSILAIQLVSKINKRTGFEMNISAVFKHKTIRQISDHIRSGLEPVVRIRPVEVAAPGEQLLSFAQERLWFIEKYEGGSHAYNIPMVFKIKPGTDVGRLLSAIKQVVRRHEVLRTVIRIDQDGRGYQEVLDEEETPLPVLEYAFSNREELDKSIAESMYRVFRLEKEYPVFAALYQYRDDQAEAQYISLVIHHIAFDAWSMDVFMKELHHYYYYVGPDGPGLPPLPLQYKDYAMWQRHYLSGPVLSEQLSYWMERLSGYETLYLRTDKPRPAQVSYAGDNVRFVLDEQLSASLRRAARQLEVSLFSLLLSAYYLLLRAYSGQQDLVVGTPIANRHYQDTHDLIGFFVNTLALREYIDDEDELAAFICRVNASVTAAQLHQDLPFEKLVDELRVEQDSSRHPVFQAMFVWQHAGRSREEQVNGLFDAYEPEYGNGYCVAKFDLSVILYDKGKEIWGTFNYATALFERATIGHYVDTYRELLNEISSL